MKHLVLIGAPGAGKGTVAKELTEWLLIQAKKDLSHNELQIEINNLLKTK